MQALTVPQQKVYNIYIYVCVCVCVYAICTASSLFGIDFSVQTNWIKGEYEEVEEKRVTHIRTAVYLFPSLSAVNLQRSAETS